MPAGYPIRIPQLKKRQSISFDNMRLESHFSQFSAFILMVICSFTYHAVSYTIVVTQPMHRKNGSSGFEQGKAPRVLIEQRRDS